MKVVCEGCSAKYSIGDEKIAGKVFKIRCKKCSRVIVLRGDPAGVGASAAASGAVPVVASAEWHVVQEGQQLGPFDSGEVQRRRAAGKLGDDSYVWREGFTDWKPLGTVDELRAELSMPMPIAVEPAQAEPAQGDGARAAAGALFGGAAARAVTGPAPAEDASKLRGARNESSLLFTLDNLARLATPAPAQAAAAPPGARGAGAAGEGSGLIDIRALARTYAPGSPRVEGARPATGAGSNIGSMADLPVFPGASFVDSSVLVPQAPRRDRRLVIGLVASFGMLAICAALLLVVMLTRKGEPTVAEGASTPPGPRVARVDPPAHRATTPAVTEPPVAPRHAVTEPAPAPASTPTRTTTPAPTPAPTRTTPTPTPAPTRVTTPTPTRTTTTPAPTPTRTTTTPAPTRTTTTPTPAPAKCDQVTCIVNGFDSDCCRALQGGNPLTPRPTQPPTSSTPLPDSLDRPAITEGLATISTKSCGGSAPAGALVKARIKVSAAGSVTSVTFDGSPDPALSACMTTQIQKGRFKKTQRGGSFAYVWRF